MLIRFSVLTTLIALLVTGAAAQDGTVRSTDRRPVLLRDSLLLPPVESTGTGLAPEVKVRVSVDATGRVADVEVLSVLPPTEYDEFFERDVDRTLKQWRYAPAIVDGRPAPAELEWTVQFRVSAGTASSSAGFLPPILDLMDDADARHARIMGLPFDKQKELLLRYAEIAERHLERGRRRQFEGERFVVVTDAATPDVTRVLAQNLDASLVFVHRLLQPHLEPHPNRLKTLVYLYSKRSAFEETRGDLLPLTCTTATYYAPGLIVYHLEVPSSEYLLSFLIHEASHAYSDHHLRRPGFSLPRWLEEGFAEYMGNSRVKKGQLLPGRTLKRQYVLNHFAPGATLQNTTAGWDLKSVKDALRKGEGLRLEELAVADRDVFYGDKADLYYGMSWLFVHFLRHGEPEWAEESFPVLMLYMAEGYPAKAALDAAYGTTFTELEAPFLEYVEKF